MPVYFISFEVKADNRVLNDAIEGIGESCRITSSSLILEAEIEIDALLDELTEPLGEDDKLFVLDLETLEVEGINLPECLEEFISSPDELLDEDDEEE